MSSVLDHLLVFQHKVTRSRRLKESQKAGKLEKNKKVTSNE